MFEFLVTIFNKAASVIVSIMITVGLVSAPAQPQVEVKIDQTPNVQEQPTNNKSELQIKIHPDQSVIKEVVPLRPQPIKTPTPDPNKIPTSVPEPMPISVPIYIQVPVPMPPPTSPPIILKPEITKFEASKYEAKLGDTITISWDSKNAVTCAISEARNIAIPFTGNLPSGTMTFTLEETGNHKIPTFNYYAICADKDWNTAAKALTINVLSLIEIKSAYACKTDLQTDYMLYDLLQNGNIDGRISMRIYLGGINEQPVGNPELIVKTSDASQDKTFKTGASGSCGYTYGEYNFHTTKAGVFPITFSVPLLNLSKTITLNVNPPEKPIIGSLGISVSTSEKETDFPISELENIEITSNVKYWFQTSKPNYQYRLSAWCSDNDTALTKIDTVSHLEKDGLYYYRGYFLREGQFSGNTTCKFIHSADSLMTIFSESDVVIFDVK